MLGRRAAALWVLAAGAGGCALVANYDFGKYVEDTGDAGAGGTATTSASTTTSTSSSTTTSTSAGASSSSATSASSSSSATSASSSSSTTSASSSSGSTGCAGTCVVPPVGWTGPLVIEPGLATCPPGFPQVVLTEPAELIPPLQAAWCGCTCNPPDCTSGTLTAYSGTACATKVISYTVSTTCTSAAVPRGSAIFTPTVNAFTPCKEAPTVGIPGLSSQTATVCGTPPACKSGGACVPTGTKYCVASASATPCPSGFPTQYLLDPNGSFHDNRTCTACTCGPWQNAGCIGGARLWDGANCTGNPFGIPAQGTCEDTSTFVGVSADLALQSVGSCQPSTSTPTGTVTANNPTTICCQP